MGGIFNDVSTDNIEAFFGGMMMCDCSLPHTTTRLSPITFCEFLNRNQLIVLNQEEVYKEANKFWKKYNGFRPELLRGCQGENYDVFQSCETPREAWNPLIDYLKRVKDVEKLGKRTFYQMHYLAHIFYLFFLDKLGVDEEERAGYKQVFNLLISPMIYTPLIPTQYAWMPVVMYTDIRFSESITSMIDTIDNFIKSHSGRYISYPQFDVGHMQVMFNMVNKCLRQIHKAKYKGKEAWEPALKNFFTQMNAVEVDVKCCETYSSFKRDGIQVCNAIDAVSRIRKSYSKNQCEDDVDVAIDGLLDVYSALKQGISKYGPEVLETVQKGVKNE